MESTQYIVLSGHESVESLGQIMGRVSLPNPVAVSYRHTGSALNSLFVEPFVVALKGAGVKEIGTLFAEPHQVDQLRRVGLDHGIAVSEG